MPTDCPNHYQARVSILMAENNLVHRQVYPPPIRYEYRVVQPPWESQVRWSWGDRYKGITSFWGLISPVSLRVENSGSRKYLYAIDANGDYRSGQYFFRDGRTFPSYKKSENPPPPIVLGYVKPPPPAIHYLDLWSRSDEDGGNFEETWEQSGQPPDVKIECSCDHRQEIQCGEMENNPEEDTWCCLSCSSMVSTFKTWSHQLENLKNRIEQ